MEEKNESQSPVEDISVDKIDSGKTTDSPESAADSDQTSDEISRGSEESADEIMNRREVYNSDGEVEDMGGGGLSGDLSHENADQELSERGTEIPYNSETSIAPTAPQSTPPIKKADFQQLSARHSDEKPRNIELLMDVELPVSIELGHTRMKIEDILALGPGSIVELDKLVGEPVDLLVNQKCVARGEVVVVEENFGLRITQLISPEERIKVSNE